MVIDQLKMPPWAMASTRVMTDPIEHDEHDRVLDLHPRVHLGDGADERLLEDLGIEEASGLRHTVEVPQRGVCGVTVTRVMRRTFRD